MEKTNKKWNWSKIIGTILFLVLLGSIVYVTVMIFTAPSTVPENEPYTKVKSDYYLSLLQCMLGLVVMFLPSFFQKKLSIEVPNYCLLYTSTAARSFGAAPKGRYTEMIAKVLVLLQEKKYALVKQAVLKMNAVDIAEVFAELHELEAPQTSLRLFRLMPKELAAETFSYMESDVQQSIIEAISDNELRFILDDMYMDDYVDLIEEMPANVVKRLLANSSDENRKLINEYLQYPEDSAGSIMTNEYVYFRRNVTVREAFDIIRKTGVDKETIYTCYVISTERKLEGVVTVRELLLADPNAAVDTIMSRCV